MELTSPALAGRFFTTEPSRKPTLVLFIITRSGLCWLGMLFRPSQIVLGIYCFSWLCCTITWLELHMVFIAVSDFINIINKSYLVFCFWRPIFDYYLFWQLPICRLSFSYCSFDLFLPEYVFAKSNKVDFSSFLILIILHPKSYKKLTMLERTNIKNIYIYIYSYIITQYD